MHILAVLTMGFTSILVQIIALRQLLTVFSGNELDIGITFAVWLLAVGLGSLFGRRLLRFRNAFEYSFFGVALLGQAAVLFISLIRPLFGLVSGETASLAVTLSATILALAPICFMIGAQFPLAVAFLKGDTAKTYGLEAAGSFLGGLLFTVLLAGNVNAPVLAAAISLVNVLFTIVLLKKKRRFIFLVIPLLFYAAAAAIVENAPEQDLDLVRRVESKYGELAVYDSQSQINLFSSGRFAFSYPDTQTEELHAHLPMSLHAEPRRVLLIGGSAAVARELLKYPSAEVDFVEIDPKMIDLCFSILTREDRELLSDKRLKVHARDAREFVRSAPSRYDVVVLNLPEPLTANLNRFYTVEFFREAGAILNDGGILALALPASHGYIGRRMQAANGAIYRSLNAVFPAVAVSSEEYGGMYASSKPVNTDPGALAARFAERRVQTDNFSPLLFKDIFDPMKTNMVAARLGAVSALNRDRRPAAYLYNLMLWSETHGGAFLNPVLGAGETPVFAVFAVLLLAAAVLSLMKRHAVYYSLFTTGYYAMAFNISILLMYQASFGYVYERIGILSALFMAGTATGAAGARFLKRSLPWAQAIDTASLLLLLAAPLFFSVEPVYYAMILLCGALAGMQFALLSRLAETTKKGERAGLLYALDLGGAVLGAFLTSILFIPLLGVGTAILALILLKASSLVLLMVLGHEKN